MSDDPKPTDEPKTPEDGAAEIDKLSPQDWQGATERVMVAGVPLMIFKPGTLQLLAEKMERDLQTPQALVLSTIARRRAEAAIETFNAAEKFREASQKYKLTLEMIDPHERRPT